MAQRYACSGFAGCAALEKQRLSITGFVETAATNSKYDLGGCALGQIDGMVLPSLGMPPDARAEFLHREISNANMCTLYGDSGWRNHIYFVLFS